MHLQAADSTSAVITLEHIRTLHPAANWPGVDPKGAEALSKRVGTMVLLTASKKVASGNKALSENKPT
jgi:hypothetical protein